MKAVLEEGLSDQEREDSFVGMENGFH